MTGVDTRPAFSLPTETVEASTSAAVSRIVRDTSSRSVAVNESLVSGLTPEGNVGCHLGDLRPEPPTARIDVGIHLAPVFTAFLPDLSPSTGGLPVFGTDFQGDDPLVR